MRHLTLILSFSLLSTCHSNKEKAEVFRIEDKTYAEQEKRDAFIKNIAGRIYHDGSCGGDTLANFPFVMHEYYSDLRVVTIKDPIIYACEEPDIDPSHIDTSVEWIRITHDGTRSLPYCIIGERRTSRTYITVKVTDDREYFPGKLKASLTIAFHDTLFTQVEQTLSKFKFWTLKHDNSNYCVTDGTIWTLEAISHGRYNSVNFYSPDACGNDTTKSFENLAMWLGNKTGVRHVCNVLSKSEKN